MIFVMTGGSIPFFNGFPGEHAIDRVHFAGTVNAFQAGLIPDWNGTDVLYRAVMGDDNHRPDEIVDIQGPVFNLQSELVVTDAETFWRGGQDNLVNPITYNAQGVAGLVNISKSL